MTDQINDVSGSVHSHIIEYDPDHPSPYFTKDNIDYIESIQQHFSGDDLKKIRSVEWFEINLNWIKDNIGSGFFGSVIPGLRPKPGADCLYVKRFSSQDYKTMMDEFMSHMPSDFPEKEKYKCVMPGYRITLPDGEIYYPSVFHGDLAQWYRRLLGAADFYDTLLGRFDGREFLLSNGDIYDFSHIKIERATSKKSLENW